jgi:hypothetical protein
VATMSAEAAENTMADRRTRMGCGMARSIVLQRRSQPICEMPAIL